MNAKAVLAALDPAVGIWLVAAGLLGRRGRPASRVGVLMMLTGAAWLIGAMAPSLYFLHRGPLVQLHLSYPSGRLRRWPVVAVTVAVYVASLVEGVVRVPWVTLALSGSVVLVAAETFARTTGPARKAARPALGAALGFAGALGLSSLNKIFRWGLDGPVAIGYDVLICAAVTLLLVDLLTGRWVDATVTDLVLDLGTRAGITGLRRQLRRALGDPTLELGIWIPGRDSYVDEAGRPLPLDRTAPERTVTALDDDGRPVAILVHDPLVLDDPSLLDAVGAATALAVANTRLQNDIEVRAAELAAARRRIVEAADLERRRLVETLRMGAETRLHTVDSLLDRVRSPGASDPLHDQVRAELHAAVDELSDLARGIRPPTLTNGGLAHAVPALAARAGLPVSTVVTVGRLPAAEEAALYFVCAEALANVAKHARASEVRIEIREHDGLVTALVIDDGVGGADHKGSGIQGLVDRVHALGGTLDVADQRPRGTRLAARLPLRLQVGHDTVEGNPT